MVYTIDTKKIIQQTFIGTGVQKIIQEASEFRLKYFELFPYLYKGNLEYEKNYFYEFSKNPDSYIQVLKYEDRIVGICTGTPLVSESQILKNGENIFQNQNINPNLFFYIGEIIIHEDFRGLHLAQELLKNIENFARIKNYCNFTFATVVRSDNDPRCPEGYRSNDKIWHRYGYFKTNLEFKFSWPTIGIDKLVQDIENTMVFWTKIEQKS